MMPMKADQALPALEWLQGYNRETLINDGLAAFIVTVMLMTVACGHTWVVKKHSSDEA